MALKLKIAMIRINAGGKLYQSICEKNIDMARKIKSREKELSLILERQEQLTCEVDQTRRLLSIQQRSIEENISCMKALKFRKYQSEILPQQTVREPGVSPEKLGEDAQFTS